MAALFSPSPGVRGPLGMVLAQGSKETFTEAFGWSYTMKVCLAEAFGWSYTLKVRCVYDTSIHGVGIATEGFGWLAEGRSRFECL